MKAVLFGLHLHLSEVPDQYSPRSQGTTNEESIQKTWDQWFWDRWRHGRILPERYKRAFQGGFAAAAYGFPETRVPYTHPGYRRAWIAAYRAKIRRIAEDEPEIEGGAR